ncbi:unnamed protein product [Trichogramma brassicae]|uniref:Uncharacterized protein n=1 Tax=Trichogramma brassicae TaxID=86971 RepID=A0A6H5I4Y8_9HYME|nr:unnamed protein product [Trichogramma brassicae]
MKSEETQYGSRYRKRMFENLCAILRTSIELNQQAADEFAHLDLMRTNSIIDFDVYNAHQNFRLIYSRKRGSSRVLLPSATNTTPPRQLVAFCFITRAFYPQRVYYNYRTGSFSDHVNRDFQLNRYDAQFGNQPGDLEAVVQRIPVPRDERQHARALYTPEVRQSIESALNNLMALGHNTSVTCVGTAPNIPGYLFLVLNATRCLFHDNHESERVFLSYNLTTQRVRYSCRRCNASIWCDQPIERPPIAQ